MSPVNILTICGSTRQRSVNQELIAIIAGMYTHVTFTASVPIHEIPHFNPDLDNPGPPAAVALFREQIRNAGGVLISSPEYAMGVPGSLKNALDWTVSSMEFSHKPVALITASSMGAKAHASLLETLTIIEAAVAPGCELLIPFVKTKIANGAVKDAATEAQVKQLVDQLLQNVNTVVDNRV